MIDAADQIRTSSSGNLLTLVVLNRRQMRKSAINTLLQGLAISDIVAPTIACIPHLIYYYGRRNDHQVIHFLYVYVMPLATGATFCSNWIGNDLCLNVSIRKFCYVCLQL